MSLRSAAVSRLTLTAIVVAGLGGTSLLAQEASPPGASSPSIGELPGDWMRRGDTGVTALPGGKFAFGVQYRVVYDRSSIPGPGAGTPDDPAGYDFFRQRVRLNVEASPKEAVGAFVQAEFRGGWGGTAPGTSDPRGVNPTLNPFNRLGDAPRGRNLSARVRIKAQILHTTGDADGEVDNRFARWPIDVVVAASSG